MSRCLSAVLLLAGLSGVVTSPCAADDSGLRPIAESLVSPESVCLGPNGQLFVTEIGEFGKNGDGRVSVIKDGKPQAFAKGLDDPKGIVFFKDAFYVADVTKVIRVDQSGHTSVYAAAEAFPNKPQFLNDIAVDPRNGTLLVTDSGDLKGQGGAVYRISPQKRIDTVADVKTIPTLNTPNGVLFDGDSHFLVGDFGSGELHRVRTADKTAHMVADGFDGLDGLAFDYYGQLFITSWKTGKVFGIPHTGAKPVVVREGLASAADLCLAQDGKRLFIPDMKSGTIVAIPTQIPGWEVDESQLPVAPKVAFPNLKWTGWDDGSESGRVVPLRPIVLTHANDGTNNLYVATQHGVIHVFDNNDNAKATKVFLDISKKVRYGDRQNEEGFLGLAFHPKFKENGEFFVFYTDAKAQMANVVSRFRTKANDRSVADPNSEEELIRFEKPFWNHDGGCLVFGPDGYLYISHGDGGSGGDPHENGQNINTLLGKVLRIDVNRKANGKNYAIPADNPFANKPNAKPEIFAYGLRNVWRIAFDRETGVLWGGEVGQNLYEEIVLITSGGNYGWNLREAFHPFGRKGVDVRDDLIEPIWEYHHDIGKSITGGAVYRGKAIPELQGAYVYADYVTTRMWALRYDTKTKKVTHNQVIPSNLAVLSFGEDQNGELYALVVSPSGKGIYRLTRSGR